ncbi:hypothetical protein JYK02_08580 [Corallococcus macrosporus]|uniref:Uncharacterized protein n=1 Tax=Corallococcus macrosporus TaxID=35 RepID=A0ABS3D9L4_9BACT|nr:hypothetical protein [Corallococcus macrosporus]MBN8227561.1 hypothetical protein [Corallococcus macrosporus]
MKPSKAAEFITQDLIRLSSDASKLGWSRFATCYSLTGLPIRILELYAGSDTKCVMDAAGMMDNQQYTQLMSHCEQRDVELLRAMSYAPSGRPDAELTANSHLLHVQLDVKDGNLSRFSEIMTEILPAFQDNGWTLLAAGHGLHPPHRVMHLWRLKDANALDQMMHKLKDVIPYAELNSNTVQHQDLMHGIQAFGGRIPIPGPGRVNASGYTTNPSGPGAG